MNATTAPTVHVVILDWQTPQLTIEAARSALACTGVEVRATILDNGCADDHRGQLRAALGTQVQLLRSPRNLGFAGGVNAVLRGIDWTWPEAIVLLNSDATLASDALAILVAELADPRLAAAAPAVWVGHGSQERLQGLGDRIDWLRGRTTLRFQGHRRSGGPLPERLDAEWLVGTCLALKPAALRDVGLLDERYFAYLEDTDWCVRAGRRGWRLRNCLRASAWHGFRRSSRCGQWLHLMLRNNVLFMRKLARRRYLLPFLVYWWCVQVPNLARWCVLQEPSAVVGAVTRAVAWNLMQRVEAQPPDSDQRPL